MRLLRMNCCKLRYMKILGGLRAVPEKPNLTTVLTRTPFMTLTEGVLSSRIYYSSYIIANCKDSLQNYLDTTKIPIQSHTKVLFVTSFLFDQFLSYRASIQ
jgi:hypothetical protein